MDTSGKVYLVGAGCGDAKLITVRGLELLRSCEILVYDDLIDRALLSEVPDGAEIIYMGKRRGRHSAKQEEISDALIRHARNGKKVVRLKGGDPFVFGRGGEETAALLEAGIPFEVVPGICSAIAIPALAGIPVTCRNVSRSVHIVTAHTADTRDGLPEDMETLAKLDGTLVFLMGLSQIEQITQRLLSAGMPEDTPASVVSGGNAPEACDVRGTLKDIAERTRRKNVRAPAVIVIGKAAGLDLKSRKTGPLAGVRIGVAGSAGMVRRLGGVLKDLGAKVFISQQSVLRPLSLSEPLGRLLDGKAKWLAFTSANGVNTFFSGLKSEGIDLRKLAACRFAAIGRATEKALADAGFRADLCPETHTTEALAEALLGASAPDEEILLLRSRQGSEELRRTLSKARAVRDVHLYEACDAPEAAEGADRAFETADYLVFTSAGGVSMFSERHGRIPAGVTAVCIGRVTEDAARNAAAQKVITAGETSVDGIVCAIKADWKRRSEEG